MIIGTCWYLSALLLLASLCASAITVVPGHESDIAVMVAGSLTGSLLCAASAIFLHMRQWHWIRESRRARNLFLGFAALATVIIGALTVG